MSRHGHRFFVPGPLSVGAFTTLVEQQAKQISGVLRLRPGDRLGLFNGDGRQYSAVIKEADRSSVNVEIISVDEGPDQFNPPIWLALALIKSDRFEWALQKATELGVERVVPIETEQSVISLPVDRAQRRLDRWRRIVVEASEQSGRCTVPEISEPVPLAQLIAENGMSQMVLLWADETTTALTAIEFESSPVLLIVGPEGGFSPGEINEARSVQVQTASLGPLTLRAETAAVAAIAMLVGRYIAKNAGQHHVEHQGKVGQ